MGEYGVEQIDKPSQRDVLRKRYGMYIGSNDSKGYHHLYYEILSNSIDEIINGYGDTITVRLIDKQTLEIEDNGRGIPFGKNKKGIEVLYMIFTELHSGGKMDNTSNNSGYKFSGGTNGVGTSVTNFLSSSMYVQSIRDGKIAELEFIDGISTKKTVIKKYTGKKKHGTLIRFSPTPTVFQTVKGFNTETIKKIIQDQIYLQKMTIIFENKITDETIKYTNTDGLEKYIIDYNSKTDSCENEDDENINNEEKKDEAAKLLVTPVSKIFLHENIELYGPEKQYVIVDYAFEFIKGNKANIKGFTNSISNPDGGKHVLGFKSGIYKGLKKLLDNGSQSDKTLSKNLIPEDVYNGIVGLISIKMPDPDFDGQTKGRMTKDYVKSLIEKELVKDIQKRVTEADLVNIRDSLQKKIDFRKKIEAENEKLERIDNSKDLEKRLRSKIKDATGKDRMKNEIYIVEGDSAGGTLKMTRDVTTQAVMPLKGKPINVFNNKATKIFKNQEINNMIYAISSGYIGKDFDIKKHLRYGKIIIAADADSDGLHIVLLVLSFLLKFYPILVEKGYVYISVTPLFACKYKNDTKYFYTAKGQEQFSATKEGKKYQVNRFKGLGEFKDKDGYKFIMSPRTRKLQKITTTDIEQTVEWYTNLMGSDSQFKFDLFNEHIHTLLEKIDNDTLGLEEKQKDIIEIGKDDSTLYSLEVNTERSIPNLEDGLKNVTRRILYTLKNDIKSKADGNFVKAATVVGATMGHYHPHGDASIYEASVGILTDFGNTHPLIEGQGNWGSPDGDSAAAFRYTEQRISKISEDYYMKELYKNSVDFIPNFDNTSKEPSILPAIIPFVLLNDNFGIGYGKMTNSMIPHNIREVLQAILAFLTKKKNEKFDALDYIKGPDVVVGNTLLNTKAEIREIYNNPRGGRFTFRVPINVIKVKKQKVLEITEYPFRNYTFENELKKIIDLIDEKKILGVKGVYDRSGVDKVTSKKGFRLFFTIDQKIDTNLIIEDIYKQTIFERTMPYTPLLLNKDKELKYYTLNEIISNFIDFRKETILRVTQYQIDELNKDLPGLYAKALQALNVHEIIKIIEKGKDKKSIKEAIIKKYNNKKVLGQKLQVDDEMAEIIINTRLINIKDLKATEDTIKSKLKEITRLQEIIDKPLVLKKLMIKEYTKILEKYKNVRRKTKILLDKDVKAIYHNKDILDKHNKALREAEKYYNNLLVVTKDDFIIKYPLQSIAKLEEKLNEFYKDKKIKIGKINKNRGKLFIFTDKNKGFNVKLEKIKDKTNLTGNILIKGFEGEPIGYAISNEDDKNDSKELFSVIYVDGKNKVGGFNIAKGDLIKNRQGYSLGKNKIVYINPTGDELKLDSIKYIRINNSQYKTKTNIDTNKLPKKKSMSSGKAL